MTFLNVLCKLQYCTAIHPFLRNIRGNSFRTPKCVDNKNSTHRNSNPQPRDHRRALNRKATTAASLKGKLSKTHEWDWHYVNWSTDNSPSVRELAPDNMFWLGLLVTKGTNCPRINIGDHLSGRDVRVRIDVVSWYQSLNPDLDSLSGLGMFNSRLEARLKDPKFFRLVLDFERTLGETRKLEPSSDRRIRWGVVKNLSRKSF